MSVKYGKAIALVLAVIFVMAGCTTTSPQMNQTVYDIHRRMVRLDKNLDDSVTKLNETTAELVARVNSSDTQARRLQSLAEENQVKLDRLARELATFKATAYRQWGMTVSPGGLEGSVGSVEVAPPTAPESTAAPETPPPAVSELPPATTTPAPSAAPAPPAAPVTSPAAPATPAPAAGDPDTAYENAQQKYLNNEYEEALQQFDALLVQFPTSDRCANAQYWKAMCYHKLGQYEPAVQQFQELRVKYPRSNKAPYAMVNQAVAYFNLGNTKACETLLQEVVDNYPYSPAADDAKSKIEKLTKQ